MQNIVVIGRVYSKLEHYEFSSNFEFDRNMLSGTDAWTDINVKLHLVFSSPLATLAGKVTWLYWRKSMFSSNPTTMAGHGPRGVLSHRELLIEQFVQANIKDNIMSCITGSSRRESTITVPVWGKSIVTDGSPPPPPPPNKDSNKEITSMLYRRHARMSIFLSNSMPCHLVKNMHYLFVVSFRSCIHCHMLLWSMSIWLVLLKLTFKEYTNLPVVHVQYQA